MYLHACNYVLMRGSSGAGNSCHTTKSTPTTGRHGNTAEQQGKVNGRRKEKSTAEQRLWLPVVLLLLFSQAFLLPLMFCDCLNCCFSFTHRFRCYCCSWCWPTYLNFSVVVAHNALQCNCVTASRRELTQNSNCM